MFDVWRLMFAGKPQTSDLKRQTMLIDLDTRLFLALNHLHAPWLDPVMVFFTERNSWIPFYVVLIGWLLYRFGWQRGGIMVLAVAVAVALSDQTASALLKPLTHRLRPCHEPTLQALIHPVLPCGGQFGFASSHAANVFALATGLWLLVGKQYRWVGWLFLWAALVAYSRIYVGAHYPLDVLAGAGIGVFWASVVARISQRFLPTIP